MSDNRLQRSLPGDNKLPYSRDPIIVDNSGSALDWPEDHSVLCSTETPEGVQAESLAGQCKIASAHLKSVEDLS